MNGYTWIGYDEGTEVPTPDNVVQERNQQLAWANSQRAMLDAIPPRQPVRFRDTRIIYDYELRPLAAAIRALFHRPDWLADWRRQRDEFAADGFELFV